MTDEEDEAQMAEADRKTVAEWIVGERAANDPEVVRLAIRYPSLHKRVAQLRALAGQLDRDGVGLRGELEAALRGRATLRDLDHVGELVARAMRERFSR